MKDKAWLVFAILGAIFTYWGLHQLFSIPASSGAQWDWLAPTPELIEYIKFRFQQMGAITLANGVFILSTSLTGFRNRERWSWWTMVSVPVDILFLTAIFYWLALFTVPVTLFAAWALWATRGSLQLAPPQKTRSFGWFPMFVVGLLILYFAYDAFFVIPALDVRDPERGWDWLTTDTAHIDYIKLYFRVYGIHVFVFSAMTLSTTFFGLKEGCRSAWQVLWLVPVLILTHLLFWPWTALLLIAIAALAGTGLWMQFKPVMVSAGQQ